jgi:adenylate cyclase
MMEALPIINADFKARGLPEFKIGIGLNSGECAVGNMGSNMIFSYTALGDNMNLGARLESLCKHYGVQILISEFTYERLEKEMFKVRMIDFVKVKGKNLPVKIYEVLHLNHPMYKDPEALDFYLMAFKHYEQKEFQECKQICEGILLAIPEDKATARLIKMSEQWLSSEIVPEDYLVTTMTEK